VLEETMTPSERIEAAIRLEKVDRIPIVPFLDFTLPSRYAGLTQQEAWAGMFRGVEVLQKLYDEVGGWDAMYHATLGAFTSWAPPFFALRAARPGKETPVNYEIQYLETEVMEFEDYDKLIKVGWNEFWPELIKRIFGFDREKISQLRGEWFDWHVRDSEAWKKKGVPVLIGAAVTGPMFLLSIYRSYRKFFLDLYYHADVVGAAIEAITPDLIDFAIATTKKVGILGADIIINRGSGFWNSLSIFEQFKWPYVKRIVKTLVDEGITPYLHLDSVWDDNLPYFAKDLPKAKCVAHFDGTTNIFKAKEILRGHMCIMGDVSAGMLCTSTPQKVEAYCKKLIDIVGQDSGFILSSGCEAPVNATLDNFKAMVDAPKKYLPPVGR